MESPESGRSRVFWPVAVVIVLLDVVTKAIASATLFPPMIPHPVLGEVARLTLVYNRGAAFGIHVGTYSRPIFAVLTVAALAILWRLYRAPETYGKCHSCGEEIDYDRLDALPHARLCFACKQREEDGKKSA